MAKMTLDNLARMINSGFDNMQKQMDERFDGVDGCFEGIEQRLDNLELAMNSIRSEIHRMWEKISDLEEQIKALNKRTIEDEDAILKEVMNLKKRLNILEKEVKSFKTAKA